MSIYYNMVPEERQAAAVAQDALAHHAPPDKVRPPGLLNPGVSLSDSPPSRGQPVKRFARAQEI